GFLKSFILFLYFFVKQPYLLSLALSHRKIPASQIEMQVSPALNFRYFTCLLDKGHLTTGMDALGL
ncbi:MAG: hypothetical protein Q4E86_03340, partial [Lachnospiraceae bacterium]|nr:hypothetical protein [Lachnospiraceae bacterium]